MRIREALQKYLLQLQADGRSEHTRLQYRRHIELLASWADAEGKAIDVRRLSHEHVAAFLVSPLARNRLDGPPKAAASQNALRSSVRVFLAYCHSAGWASSNAARLVRRAFCGTPPPRALSVPEVKSLLGVLGKAKDPEGRRDALMFRLMLEAGLRLGSVVGMRRDEIDFQQGIARVRVKGQRVEDVVIPASLCRDLRRYIRVRKGVELFPGRYGGHLVSRHVQRRFAMWRQRAGLRPSLSCHSLRHTFAVRLLERTGDIELVRRALSHRSVSTTQVYARCSDRRLREAVEA